MDKVLVTGIAGFVGSHLAEELVERGFEVWGTHIDNNLENLSHVLSEIRLIKCDLLDRRGVVEALRRSSPDFIIHLAAQSAPSLSFSDPDGTLRTNIFSTLNLFEALLETGIDPVVINVGSGDEYGDVGPDECPLSESRELRPMNIYAVSKVAQEMLSFQYWRGRGVKVIRCRPFNHIGPRQSENFVASSLAKQIAEIEAGFNSEGVLKVGNLDSRRDFLDVRDVVSAYILLMNKGRYGEVYNICSGRTISIGGILDILKGYSTADIKVVSDPERIRASDTHSICGDPSRLMTLGWSPEHDIRETLRLVLDFWRKRLSKGT